MTLYDASGRAAGVGDATATAGLLVSADGTSAGSGGSFFGPGQTVHYVLADLAGGSAFEPNAPLRSLIFTGRTAGVGLLVDELTMFGSGTLFGSGNVTGSPSRVLYASGSTSGLGTIELSIPNAVIGIGSIAGFAQIQTVPRPICQPICGCDSCCGRREETCEECFQWHRRHFHCEAWWWQCRDCWRRHAEHRRGFDFDHGHEGPHEHEWTKDPTRPMGQFRWNQTFGKGDLEICLRDRWGNQRGPVFIGYTMYVVTSTGVLHQVGPTDRKPAKADVGKFYVTGTAGENGQPGCWAVKWRYQRTYSEPMIEQVQQFRVLDAVLDCDRPDPVRRHCKYGWDL